MLVFFMGCKPENSLNVQPDKDQFELKSQKEKLAADFAKMLASSLNQVELRQYIKDKGLQKFDGDYDILFSKEKDERIQVKTGKFKNSSPTFAELIVGSANKGRFKNGNTSDDYIDSLNKLYPLLQIAIPELPNASIETWDIENHVPLVAVSTLDNETDGYIEAYDSDGNVHRLGIDTPPDELMIVVGANERIKVIPKESTNKSLKLVCLPEEPYYSDANNDYYLKTDYYDAQNRCILPDPDDGGTGTGTTTCDRDRNSSKDILEKVRFNTMKILKRAEPWSQGAIEVAVFITFGNKDGAFSSVKEYFTGARGNFKNCSWMFNCSPVWMSSPRSTFTWKKEDFGDRIHYKWYEEDADDWAVTSSTIEHTISFSTKIDNTTYTNSTKITITDEDYDLGHKLTEYCDNTDGVGYTYNTGKFSFVVKQ